MVLEGNGHDALLKDVVQQNNEQVRMAVKEILEGPVRCEVEIFGGGEFARKTVLFLV